MLNGKLIENTFVQNIPAEGIMEFAPLEFPGKIVVVDKVEALKEVCEDLMSHPVIGFDTETRPAFKPGVSYKVSMLQLSTPETCYLIRLCQMPLDKSIIKVLESKNVLKIGADVNNDLRSLKELRKFKPAGFVDLQDMVSEWGIAEKSVRKMSCIVLGYRVTKAKRLTNWASKNLTDRQLMYAATDAWVCGRIYEKLMKTEKKPLSKQPETATGTGENNSAAVVSKCEDK